MQLSVNGIRDFRRHRRPGIRLCRCPTIVLLHGAGFDHTSWALHSRWFAHHGYGVLAPDLPGHGRSSGAPLPTIADMADWTAALLDAAGAAKARLIGHSMGSLIALETAARHPAKVSALGLIGTAATMTVGPDLLKAAEANDHAAIDMVSIWGLGYQAELGGSLAPGLWMHSRRPTRAGNEAGPACCSTTSPPATPIRMRWPPPRKSPCRPRSFSANAT